MATVGIVDFLLLPIHSFMLFQIHIPAWVLHIDDSSEVHAGTLSSTLTRHDGHDGIEAARPTIAHTAAQHCIQALDPDPAAQYPRKSEHRA